MGHFSHYRPNKFFPYFLTKMAAAGFMLGVIAIYMLIMTGFDLYEFSEGLTIWFLVLMIYSIICSMLIDLIKLKVKQTNQIFEVLLYIIAGFAPFIFTMVLPFIIIAGTVGAICAVIYLFATHFVTRNRIIKIVLAFVIPILLLISANIDFTTKTNWQETRNNTSYAATFDYFNGKHEIPIQVKAGKTITFSVEFIEKNHGGYGFSMRDDNRDYLGMEEVGDDKFKITAPKDGDYYVEIRGDSLQGRVLVNWGIE
ncbi:hypothetical protein [Paucisalibacillus sp. EB02]|uniref:hypothetical protein n=1 Tax=Paucisalibacillus sp. EB02 TaxID=1347087 RepID=UPI0004BAFFB4|nr:hypothetical protein [Paucisalibacillus sp. EB02]